MRCVFLEVCMEKWMRRTIELGIGLVFTEKGNPSVVPYYPQKTRLPRPERKYFRRTAPQRMGVSPQVLNDLLAALEEEANANIHNFLCLKDGAVICECTAPGYSGQLWHLSHSMSKTVVGMAIGMLVDEGRLDVDTALCEIFPEVAYRDKKFPDITVKHLLNMTAGVAFSEPGSVSEVDWTEAFFSSAVAFRPGTEFCYNSMNSYILGRIVARLTGLTLTEFLEERLLRPLGISEFFWEMGPEGVEKGGWGIFMSLENWCKLGCLILNGGELGGRRILSSRWVQMSTTDTVPTPESVGEYSYGYHMWVSKTEDYIMFSGMLGQCVWICPKNKIIVGLNCGNSEIFGTGSALKLIHRYLGSELAAAGDIHVGRAYSELARREAAFFESRVWVRRYKPPRGIGYLLGLKRRTYYPVEWEQLLGRYDLATNNRSVMPLFIRTMQNNFSGGLESVSFEKRDGRMLFSFTEGGHEHSLEIGFVDYADNVLDFNGEKYIVRAIGEAMEDEERRPLFKLELLLPEMPNTRRILLDFPEEGGLRMRMRELPDHSVIQQLVEGAMLGDGKMTFVFELLKKKLGDSFVSDRLEDAFSPTLVGARAGSEAYDDILSREEARISVPSKTLKFITSLSDRFIHEEEYESTEEKNGIIGFIGGVVDKIKAKFGADAAVPEDK